MRAIPKHLILGLAALVALTPFTASAARPILEVWTATPNPQGRSSCIYCDRFWEDYQTNSTLRDTLNHAFEVRARYRDSNIIEAKLKLATSVPTFIWSNHRVVGYTTPEDLMARLGLRPIQRQAPPRASPAATEQKPPDNSQLNEIAEQIRKNRENLNLFAKWLQDDQAKHESHDSAIKDFNLRLRGITEFLGKIQNQQAKPTPLEPAPKQPDTEEKTIEDKATEEQTGFIDNLLRFGRYPATWFLGPAGGAGATALLWLYQRRKKKAQPVSNDQRQQPPIMPPLSPPLPKQPTAAPPPLSHPSIQQPTDSPPPVPNIFIPSQAKTETVYVRVPVPDPAEEAKRKAERALSMSNAEAAAFFDYRDRLATPQSNPLNP